MPQDKPSSDSLSKVNPTSIQKIRAKRRGKEWFVVNIPISPYEYGPYDSKTEADEDAQGAIRFFTYDYPKMRTS